MNSTSPQGYYAGVDPVAAPAAGFPYGITFSMVIFILLALLTYGSYKCRRIPPPTSPDSSPTHDHDSQKGLDAKVLQSYPMFTFEELKKDGSTGMACAICLADYNDVDSLRLLPNCGHVFHVQCVDPWLVRRASCPNCRSSPEFLSLVQAPIVGPH